MTSSRSLGSWSDQSCWGYSASAPRPSATPRGRSVGRGGLVGYHAVGIGPTYIVLLTVFYMDNGPRLQVWDRLPAITYWVPPSMVGVPLRVRVS
jgi:hypothetical protein